MRTDLDALESGRGAAQGRAFTPDTDRDPPAQAAPIRRRAATLARLRALFEMRIDRSASRIALLALGFLLVYAMIAGRLVQLGLAPEPQVGLRKASSASIANVRPDIVDRNGELLATDVKMISVFGEPRKIIDKDEATELLTAVLPDLDARELREKLSTKRGFVWIKREITPEQHREVFRLGLPGVGFVEEKKRVYPNGVAGAHVIGFANIDNVGIAGIEKHIDAKGLGALHEAGLAVRADDLKPVRLSLDLRVQHALRDELAKGMAKFRAIAAAGAILDVESGEVIALVSLPDFDPNDPKDALDPTRINRLAVGVFEMGSTFKALTTAMALDSGRYTLGSSIDARSGSLRYGGRVIRDYKGKNRALTLPEVFIYSSNIATAKLALGLGVEHHKAFLRRTGQLDRLVTELPENAKPIVPQRWAEVNTATIAFGHGLSVAPLQAMMATAALVNGGVMIPPTFLARTPEAAKAIGVRVVKPETSEAMRFLMRLNAEKGSAGRANVPGYYVGGKTGTAEKVINGRYSKNRNFTTFMAVTPADKPRYLFLTLYDEPQGLPETGGYATSGWNASPTTARIIERVGPMLGLTPRFEPPPSPFPSVARFGLGVAR